MTKQVNYQIQDYELTYRLKLLEKGQIWLVAVKAPFDSTNKFLESKKSNENTYEELRSEQPEKIPDWQLKVKTISVGRIGSWFSENHGLLKNFGVADIVIIILK